MALSTFEMKILGDEALLLPYLDRIDLNRQFLADPRPLIAFSLADTIASTRSITLFYNTALQNRALLLQSITGIGKSNVGFRTWATDDTANSIQNSYIYSGFTWVKFKLQADYVIVLAISPISDGREDSAKYPPTLPVRKHRSESSEEQTKSRWSEGLPSTPGLSEHLNLFRIVPWATTSLGSMETWPPYIHQLLRLMLLDPRPAAIFLGSDNVFLYNEAYVPILGDNHPSALGKRGPCSGIEIWNELHSALERAQSTGLAIRGSVTHTAVVRNNELSEYFYTWCLIPVISSFNCYYLALNDITEVSISKRTLSTVYLLETNIQHVTTLQDISALGEPILRGLSTNGFDFPLAMVYSLRRDMANASPRIELPSSTSKFFCFLKGKIGIPDGHKAAPARIDLWASEDGFAPYFREAVRSKKPVVLSSADHTLPPHLLRGTTPIEFREVCQKVVVCPIQPAAHSNMVGFLVVGLNPRRPYDEEYQQSVMLVERLLADSALYINSIRNDSTVGSDPSASNPNMFPNELQLRIEEAQHFSEKLRRFQRMAEMSTVGMFDFHPSGRLIQANDTWFHLSGYPRDYTGVAEIIFKDYVFEDDVEMVLDAWATLLRGEPITFEMRWKPYADNGQPIPSPADVTWVIASCLPVANADGTIASISGCTVDITAQKQHIKDAEDRVNALERATASEQRFADFASLAPVAIYILDTEGRMKYCNDKWFEITGSVRRDFTEIQWLDNVVEEDLKIVEDAWRILTETRHQAEFQFRLKKRWKRGGNEEDCTWVMALACPELSKTGEVNDILATMIDISHFKWAERVQERQIVDQLEAKRQKQQIADALKAKQQQENFIDMTSHEMRNPLSAVLQCADSIIAWLDEINKAMDTSQSSPGIFGRIQEKVDNCLGAAETITSCAIHQNRVIDDILTLSKLDSNLLNISPVKIRPASIVEDALRMFELQLKSASINVDFQVHHSIQALGIDWVMLDPSRVFQILINLLTNAIKFTELESRRQIKVKLSAFKRPSPEQLDNNVEYIPRQAGRNTSSQDSDNESEEFVFVHFAIQDTGCGLTATEKQRLFARFAQASPRTHVQYGGAGLGLFISRELCEMQGGEIGVASEAGQGSTFAFYVKAQKAQPPSKQTEWKRGIVRSFSHGGPEKNPKEPPSLGDMHILVVEDNLVNQKVLCQQLKRLGHEVAVASHGGEALNFLQTTHFWKDQELTGKPLSIVLIDIEMPVMDGLTCVREIRRLEREHVITSHIPVIAISANARAEQIADAKNCGMDEVVVKPFRMPDLIPKMEFLVASMLARESVSVGRSASIA